MNQPATTPTVQNTTKPAATERFIAYTATAAPIATGILAPFLDGSASITGAIAYGATAGFLAANQMNRLPDHLLNQLPAGDVIRAQRSPLFTSTLTTGMALLLGTVQGPQGADALMAGFLGIAEQPIPGILSLGWWCAVALVPYKLRRVLAHPRTKTKATPQTAGPPGPTATQAAVPRTAADQIAYRWYEIVSNRETGTHKGQELTLDTLDNRRWTGTITAPTGQNVTVTNDTVSSAYRIPAPWITIRAGNHSGERHITVNLTAPPELDTNTLAGAWKKWIAKRGGLMEGTTLEGMRDDPNTGGQVAIVTAGDDLDRPKHPDRMDLAGALRVDNPLLISYEPRQNPRQAVIRKMTHNPLEEGAPFPGTHVLKVNANGYIQLGRGISGFPTRIQLWDPALGAQHCIVAGVTGSGKGGTLQIVALAHHVNGSAIIYGDPKGSSNPAITKMAAYSGLGPDEAMGALRIWYHGLMHRVEQSARDQMKNFQSTPERPWAPLILDETSKLCGENAEHKKEATFILNAGATLGRSMGMPVILANQLLQLKEFGGDAAIRDNVFLGGSLMLLRADSSQKHLIDLPDNFAGCNPADIPPAWSGERDIIYNPDTPDNDPVRTFGLGFAASPGAHAEMSRTWILEDATDHIDTDKIAYPADWPFWDQRHDLAQVSVLPADAEDDDLDADGASALLSGISLGTKKPATSAEDKIIKALAEFADPAGIDINYMHKDDIGRHAGVEGRTLGNALTDLVKARRIHRQTDELGKEVRGYYGLGPAPDTE